MQADTGLAQAAEFARADPSARVLLIALELCSLTFQRHDHSKRNLVAAALFGDGAAAVIVAGKDAPRPPRAGSRPRALRRDLQRLHSLADEPQGLRKRA